MSITSTRSPWIAGVLTATLALPPGVILGAQTTTPKPAATTPAPQTTKPASPATAKPTTAQTKPASSTSPPPARAAGSGVMAE